MANKFIFRTQNSDFVITDDVDPNIEKLRGNRADIQFMHSAGVYVFKDVNTKILLGSPTSYEFSNIIDFETGLAFPTQDDLNNFLSSSLGFFFNPDAIEVEVIGGIDSNVISAANSTAVLLGIGATFTGAWENVINYNTVDVAVLGSVTTEGTLFFDLSTDGGTTFTSVPSSIGDTTFAVPRILNLAESHIRIRYENGATAQTGTWSLQTKYSVNGNMELFANVDGFINGETPVLVSRSVIAGNILDDSLQETGVFGNASLLANRALKTAIPPTTIYQVRRPIDAVIPTGAAITIDPVLNTEPNVLDSGWLAVKAFGGGSLVNMITDTPIQAYLMNSSDDLGNNIAGNSAPTITSVAGSSATIGAPFFDDYFRIVLVNVSGVSADEYSIIVKGNQTAAPPVFSSLNQPVFGFFPAPLVRAALTGEDPDGLFKNVATTRNGNLAQTITDADTGFSAIVTAGGGLKIAEQTHLVGAPFGGSALSTDKWEIVLVGSGTQDAAMPGELTMRTGTTADSSSSIQSVDVARFIPANYNTSHHAVTLHDGASYYADNIRSWGAFNAASGSVNGVFFEIDSGTWYLSHCINGVTTRYDQAAWNGAGKAAFPHGSITANVYETEYNAGSIVWRVNNNVIHRATLLASPFANNIHFPVGMSNTNINGNTTDVDLHLRAAAIYTLGKGKGSDRPFFVPGLDSGSIVKTGPGHLGKVIFARVGNIAGDAEVKIYDALSATNQIGEVAIGGDGVSVVDYDLTFNTGLFITVTGNGTLNTTITFD